MPRTFPKTLGNYGEWGTSAVGARLNGAGSITAGIRYRVDSIPTTALGDNGLILILHGDNSGVGMAIGDGVGANLIAYGRARFADPQVIQSSGVLVTTGTYHTSFIVMNFAGSRLQMHHDGSMIYDAAQTWGAAAYLHQANSIPDQIALAWGAVSWPPFSTNHMLGGAVDWAGIWNTTLTASEMSSINAGAWPGAVQTASLRELNILTALRSPETSMVSGGTSFTVTGSLPSATGASFWAPWRGPNVREIGGH